MELQIVKYDKNIYYVRKKDDLPLSCSYERRGVGTKIALMVQG